MLQVVAVLLSCAAAPLRMATSPLRPPARPRFPMPLTMLEPDGMTAKDVTSILQELDEAVAAAGAAKAARLKTEQEQIAARKAKQSSAGRVTVFGARLDDDIAGDNVALSEKPPTEEHERLFEQGIALMKRGEYKMAVKAFTQATAAAPGGLTARRGGQYAIYLAQALQAANRKKEAVGLLKRCESHPDADVRKIADNVLYIMQAPELKLESDQFMSIPSIDLSDDWGRGRRTMEQKDPPPEKYSLEWYVLEAEKNRNRKAAEPADPAPALLACGALMLGTFALLLMRSS